MTGDWLEQIRRSKRIVARYAASMKKQQNKTNSCLYPDCGREIRARGLCMNHYLMAGRLVASKQITWETLEENGKAFPSRRVGPYSSQDAKWFLTENKNTKGKK